MRPPIIVVGGPRSGTTLTMRLLHKCGMQVGKLAAAHPLVEGPIRDQFYKPVLKRGGFDELAQKNLPPPGWNPGMPAEIAFNSIVSLIGSEVDFDKPWGFKGVKGLLMWPLLYTAFPDANWVVVRRKRAEHVASLMRTSFMTAYSDKKGWNYYLDLIEEHINSVLEGPAKTVEFWPAYVRDRESGYVGGVISSTGVQWDERAMDVFDKKLYRKA